MTVTFSKAYREQFGDGRSVDILTDGYVVGWLHKTDGCRYWYINDVMLQDGTVVNLENEWHSLKDAKASVKASLENAPEPEPELAPLKESKKDKKAFDWDADMKDVTWHESEEWTR